MKAGEPACILDAKRIERYLAADHGNRARLDAIKSFDQYGSARDDDWMPDAGHRRSQWQLDAFERIAGRFEQHQQQREHANEPQRQSQQRGEHSRRQ